MQLVQYVEDTTPWNGMFPSKWLRITLVHRIPSPARLCEIKQSKIVTTLRNYRKEISLTYLYFKISYTSIIVNGIISLIKDVKISVFQGKK